MGQRIPIEGGIEAIVEPDFAGSDNLTNRNDGCMSTDQLKHANLASVSNAAL